MNKEEALKRINKLKEQINKYRYAYHVLNQDLVSPEVLDSLKKELFDLESKFPEFITPDSPTQRIAGKPLAQFKKVKHFSKMYSFNDAFSKEDLFDWFKRIENYLGYKIKPEFYCELKIDGLAVELIYENGLFVLGSTRGDGLIGEDVTQNLKTIEAIPLKIEKVENLKLPEKLVVRGEVFLTKEEFKRINLLQKQKGEKVFANPRNMAAGTLRQLDPKIVLERKLDSFQYDIVNDVGQKTHEEEHLILKKLGFKTNPYNKLVFSLEEVIEFREYWDKNREKLPYEIDGIVVILNDNYLYEAAGFVGKAPRGAIAFKFSPKEATTIVEDIFVQVGRTGILTPVAKLKPVNVGGVTITKATLHNEDEIKRLGLKIKDTVIVKRAGDVIPKITQVLKDLRTGEEKDFKMPKICPIDKAKVIKEGSLYRCSNKNCGARNQQHIVHFVKVLEIKGLGEKIINRFLDEGLITDFTDIFTLKEDDILVLERFGEKSAKNIVQEIKKHKIIPLEKFIFALGILNVGEETAILLARQFPVLKAQITVLEFLNFFQNLKIEDLLKIRDIGPKVAQNIYNWFHDSYNINLLKKLADLDIVLKVANISKSQKLKGLTFVLTGGLEKLTREEAKNKIRMLGGEVTENVSLKVNYVVVGKDPGSKYEKAKKLNLKIINEEEFLNLIKD